MGESNEDLKVELLFQGLIPFLRKCLCFVPDSDPNLAPVPSVVETRFGGAGYMEAGQHWPQCDRHNAPLDFICQLRLPDHLPDMPRRVSLVCLYYCWSCSPREGMALSERGPVVAHLYEDPAEPLAVDPGRPESLTRPAAASVCRESICLPSWSDLPEELKSLSRAANPGAPDTAYDYLVEAVNSQKHGGTRVGGYPGWCTGASAVVCPQCSAPMVFLAQLDHDPALGLDWSEKGRMYLFFCKDHAGQLAYRLQPAR